MLTAVLALTLAAAPVPPPRARPAPARPPAPGRCVMTWQGNADWQASFDRSGGYAAWTDKGSRFEGHWAIDKDRLVIRERLVTGPAPGGWVEYTFALVPGRWESVCGKFGLKAAPE
jgi:hypothetical protein